MLCLLFCHNAFLPGISTDSVMHLGEVSWKGRGGEGGGGEMYLFILYQQLKFMQEKLFFLCVCEVCLLSWLFVFLPA